MIEIEKEKKEDDIELGNFKFNCKNEGFAFYPFCQ